MCAEPPVGADIHANLTLASARVSENNSLSELEAQAKFSCVTLDRQDPHKDSSFSLCFVAQKFMVQATN